MTALLARLSGYERVEAVHRTFAEKSSDDATTTLFWSFVILTGLLAFLAISHRIQTYFRKREEARRHPLTRRFPPVEAGDLPRFGSSRPHVTGSPLPPEGPCPGPGDGRPRGSASERSRLPARAAHRGPWPILSRPWAQ